MGTPPKAANPFDGPRIKLKRARRHIQELGQEIDQHFSRIPIVAILSVRETDQGGRYQTTLATRLGIPDEIPAIFGDAIHNLRVALDIMANDVVALAGVVPKGVYFPFANDETGLTEQINSKMRGAPQDVRALVRSLKPYKGGNVPLRAIHDLDIRDKHIAAIAAAISGTTPEFKAVVIPGQPPRLDYSSLRFGDVPEDVLAPLSPLDPGFKHVGVMLDAEFEAVIAEELPLGGKPVIATLNELAQLVEGIVETFEAHCLRRS